MREFIECGKNVEFIAFAAQCRVGISLEGLERWEIHRKSSVAMCLHTIILYLCCSEKTSVDSRLSEVIGRAARFIIKQSEGG